MKWFLLIFFIHISQYNSPNPTNVKFVKIDKEYSSLKECQENAPKEIIKKLQEFKHMYDWKRAACTDSAFTAYLHPTYPNLEGETIKYENKNRSHINSD